MHRGTDAEPGPIRRVQARTQQDTNNLLAAVNLISLEQGILQTIGQLASGAPNEEDWHPHAQTLLSVAADLDALEACLQNTYNYWARHDVLRIQLDDTHPSTPHYDTWLTKARREFTRRKQSTLRLSVELGAEQDLHIPPAQWLLNLETDITNMRSSMTTSHGELQKARKATRTAAKQTANLATTHSVMTRCMQPIIQDLHDQSEVMLDMLLELYDPQRAEQGAVRTGEGPPTNHVAQNARPTVAETGGDDITWEGEHITLKCERILKGIIPSLYPHTGKPRRRSWQDQLHHMEALRLDEALLARMATQGDQYFQALEVTAQGGTNQAQQLLEQWHNDMKHEGYTDIAGPLPTADVAAGLSDPTSFGPTRALFTLRSDIHQSRFQQHYHQRLLTNQRQEFQEYSRNIQHLRLTCKTLYHDNALSELMRQGQQRYERYCACIHNTLASQPTTATRSDTTATHNTARGEGDSNTHTQLHHIDEQCLSLIVTSMSDLTRHTWKNIARNKAQMLTDLKRLRDTAQHGHAFIHAYNELNLHSPHHQRILLDRLYNWHQAAETTSTQLSEMWPGRLQLLYLHPTMHNLLSSGPTRFHNDLDRDIQAHQAAITQCHHALRAVYGELRSTDTDLCNLTATCRNLARAQTLRDAKKTTRRQLQQIRTRLGEGDECKNTQDDDHEVPAFFFALPPSQTTSTSNHPGRFTLQQLPGLNQPFSATTPSGPCHHCVLLRHITRTNPSHPHPHAKATIEDIMTGRVAEMHLSKGCELWDLHPGDTYHLRGAKTTRGTTLRDARTVPYTFYCSSPQTQCCIAINLQGAIPARVIRPPGTIQVADLCCGLGSTHIVSAHFGIHPCIALDKDGDLAETYHLNHDMAMTIGTMEECQYWQDAAQAAIWVAGFPCQPWSGAGNRLGWEDPRADTISTILRMLEAARPEVLILENVARITKIQSGTTWTRITTAIQELGYTVVYTTRNANAHTPQFRDRVFARATRKDLPHGTLTLPTLRLKRVTNEDILQRTLRKSELTQLLLDEDQIRAYSPQQYSQSWPFPNYPRVARPQGHCGTVMCSYYRADEYANRLETQWKDAPHTAFIHGTIVPVSPTQWRFLTLTELKRLQVLPEHFSLPANRNMAAAFVGNSFPPTLLVPDFVAALHTLDDQTNADPQRLAIGVALNLLNQARPSTVTMQDVANPTPPITAPPAELDSKSRTANIPRPPPPHPECARPAEGGHGTDTAPTPQPPPPLLQGARPAEGSTVNAPTDPEVTIAATQPPAAMNAQWPTPNEAYTAPTTNLVQNVMDAHANVFPPLPAPTRSTTGRAPFQTITLYHKRRQIPAETTTADTWGDLYVRISRAMRLSGRSLTMTLNGNPLDLQRVNSLVRDNAHRTRIEIGSRSRLDDSLMELCTHVTNTNLPDLPTRTLQVQVAQQERTLTCELDITDDYFTLMYKLYEHFPACTVRIQLLCNETPVTGTRQFQPLWDWVWDENVTAVVTTRTIPQNQEDPNQADSFPEPTAHYAKTQVDDEPTQAPRQDTFPPVPLMYQLRQMAERLMAAQPEHHHDNERSRSPRRGEGTNEPTHSPTPTTPLTPIRCDGYECSLRSRSPQTPDHFCEVTEDPYLCPMPTNQAPTTDSRTGAPPTRQTTLWRYSANAPTTDNVTQTHSPPTTRSKRRKAAPIDTETSVRPRTKTRPPQSTSSESHTPADQTSARSAEDGTPTHAPPTSAHSAEDGARTAKAKDDMVQPGNKAPIEKRPKESTWRTRANQPATCTTHDPHDARQVTLLEGTVCSQCSTNIRFKTAIFWCTATECGYRQCLKCHRQTYPRARSNGPAQDRYGPPPRQGEGDSAVHPFLQFADHYRAMMGNDDDDMEDYADAEPATPPTHLIPPAPCCQIDYLRHRRLPRDYPSMNCSRCHYQRRYQSHNYQCPQCLRDYCGRCRRHVENALPKRRAEPSAAPNTRNVATPMRQRPPPANPGVVATPAVPTAQSPASPPANDDTQIPPEEPARQDRMNLLQSLRAIPTIGKLRTYKWVPGRLDQRWGSMYAGLINAAVQATLLTPDTDEEEQAHLLMREAARITLWIPTTTSAEEETSTTNASAYKLVQKRLQMAEEGKWNTLIAHFLEQELLPNEPREAKQATRIRQLDNAVQKIAEGNIKGATQILMGLPRVEPSQSTVEAVFKLFATEPLSEPNQARLDEACKKAHEAQQRHPLALTIETTRKRLHALNAGAQPGPSGLRNGHITTLLKTRQGAESFLAFSQLWANFRLSPRITILWLQMRTATLRKPNGGVRPIGLLEAPLKAAIGLCMKVASPDMRAALEPQQVSVHTPGGGEEIIFTARAMAVARPDLAQVKLDMKNAYGAASKIAGIEEATEAAPAVANTMANIAQGPFCTWVQGDDDQWVRHLVYDGFVQGETGSNPAFCMSLRKALRTFVQAHPQYADLLFKVYADDILVFIPPDRLLAFLATLKDHLAIYQLHLETSKTAAWVPAWSGTPAPVLDELPLARELRAALKLEEHGLHMLGSGADDSWTEEALGPFRFLAEPIGTRMAKAKRLASIIHEILDAELAHPKLHPCWLLIQRVLLHAFSYDARVTAPDVVTSYTDELRILAIELALKILDIPAEAAPKWLTDSIMLPARHGGAQLADPRLQTHVAHLAAMTQVEERVLEQLRRAVPRTNTEQARTYIDYSGVAACRQHLWNRGINIDNMLRVYTHDRTQQLAEDPTASSQDSQMSQSAQDLTIAPGLESRKRGLASRVMRIMHAQEASRIATVMPTDSHKARMRSCSGPVAGAFLNAIPKHPDETMTDAEFRIGMQWRFGQLRPQGRCKHQPAQDNHNVCDSTLDPM